MPMSIRMSSSEEEEFWGVREEVVSFVLNDEDLVSSLMTAAAQLLSLKRASNRTSLIEAKAQRQQMKKIEERIKPRRSAVFAVFIMVICAVNRGVVL